MTEEQRPQGRGVAYALIAVTAFVAVHRLVAGDFAYVIWSDRDLVRSAVPFLDLPTSGAELSYGAGAQIPGGAYSAMLWLAQQVTSSPHGVWQIQVGLDALAAALLGFGVGRRFGWLAGAVSAAGLLGADPNSYTQERLWNPAWLTIFASIATVAWIRVVADRTTRAILWWGLAIALGGQTHVSALMLAPALLPFILIARPPGAAKWLVATSLGALAVYAPYLVSEAALGWPNTQLLWHPEQLSDAMVLVSSDARPAQTAWETLLSLGGAGGVTSVAARLGGWAIAAGLIAPLLVVGVLFDLGADSRDREPRARVLGGLVAAILIATAVFSRARYYAMGTTDTTRYLLALTPLTAALVGIAGAGAVRAAKRWGRLAVPLAATLLGASTLVHLIKVDLHTRDTSPTIDHWRGMREWLDRTTAATGWTLQEVAGRLIVTESVGPHHWRATRAAPIEALLRAQGMAFPGSLPPPCAALLSTPPSDAHPIDDATLAATLGDGVVRPHVDARHTVGPNLTLIVYHPEVGRCPTNLGNRYVLTPEEELSRAAWPTTPLGTARRLPDHAGARRWALNLDLAAGTGGTPLPMPALIELRTTGDHQEVSLHANLLRGYAWNGGFFANGDADHPRLVVTLADGTTTAVDLAAGRVGLGGELTPLHVAAVVPPDATLTFEIDVQPQRAFNPSAARAAGVVVRVPLP